MEPGGRRPAPEPIAVIQRFVNTVDIEDGHEALPTPRALGTWLLREGLLETPATLDHAWLHKAIALREGIRALLAANAGHVAADRATIIAGAQEIMADLPLHARPAGQGGLDAVPHGADPVQVALARLVAIALRASADGTWRRLKVCTRSQCQWAFYDWSKNQSGIWCSMDVCGIIAKKRGYVERRRQRRAMRGDDSGASPRT